MELWVFRPLGGLGFEGLGGKLRVLRFLVFGVKVLVPLTPKDFLGGVRRNTVSEAWVAVKELKLNYHNGYI